MPPKKKKGDGSEDGGKPKASKLNKMNEMDRVKYLERRMAEEVEGKKRKEEMVSGYLRLKLDHEEKSVSLNKAKLTDQWRTILRKAKSVDLKRDVLTLKDAFERALDKKKKYIGGLLSELDEAEEQYSMAFRAQMENMERMMNIHQSRLDDQHLQFSRDKDRLMEESSQDKQQMITQQKESEDYLNDVQIALDQNHTEVEGALRTHFQSRKDEIRNRNLEELTTLKNSMEEMMDGLWSSLQTHIIEYKESTADKRRTYGELLAKDKKGVAELSSNNTKLSRLQEEITDFKKKVNEGGADIGPEMDQLRKERETLTAQLHEVRRRVSVVYRNHEHAKLRRLAVESHEILKMLTRLLEDQEHLIKLHKLVQKVATQQDIALTLESPGEKYLKEDEMELIKDLDDAMWDPKLQIPEEFRNLEPMWRKLNKASLDFTAMKRENKELMMESSELQRAMRQYLDLVSRQGGEELSRAGIEAEKRERAGRRESRARIDPGGQFGYEMFRM